MQRGLRAEIQRIIIIGLLLIGLGLLNGHLLLTLLFGGTLYMAWTFTHIFKLYRWLEGSRKTMPPEADGVWGDISDQLYRMQQQNRRARDLQRAMLARTKSITTALDEGLLLLNANRELDWWNPAAETLLKLQKTDRHQSIINLIRTPAFVTYIQGKKFKKPVEIAAPDNSQRKLLFSAATFDQDNIALVVQDITQLRNMEQMRTDFVANISHELRTPLTVISGYIETLQANNDSLPKAWHKALDQMEQQTRRMSTLANDLVMLSQLESMEEKPSSESVPLLPLLEQIATDTSALGGEKFQVSLDCPSDLEIPGESKELYSAFSNLAFNAIKHNPDGAKITISAKQEKQAVTVSVEDDGVGIDPKHIGRLTERFYRADQSRAANTGGTGLGLAIVKHVLLRHHATLSIRSRLGKGSMFTCRFANINQR